MSIYVGDKKALLLKSDNSVVEFYKGDKKLFGYDGKESGSIISVNDVTPIEHNVGVKVASKNLFDFPLITTTRNKWDNNNSMFGIGRMDVSHLRGKTITFQAFIDLTNIDENNVSNYTNLYGCVMLWFYKSDGTYIAAYGGNNIYYSQRTGISKYTIKVPDVEGVNAYFGARASFYGYVTTEALGEDYIKFSNPMVELGTTASPYTPFITNFADGGNLIPYPYAETTKTVDGITFTDNGDGSITLNGTEVSGGAYFQFTGNEYVLLTKGTYTIIGNPSNDCEIVVLRYLASGGDNYIGGISQRGGTPATFEVTEDTYCSVFVSVTVEGASFNNVTINPQITDARSIGVEVARYGKNLCSNVYTEYADTGYKSKYIADVPLIMSLTDKDTSVDVSGCYFGWAVDPDNVNDGYRWVVNNGTVRAIKTNTSEIGEKQCPYLIMYPFGEATFNKIMRRWNIQVEYGTVSSGFEQYKPRQTYTANADGTVEGVKSISPNMTLIPNNNAVSVECEYCKA